MNQFKPYNKEELISKIDKISIEMVGSQVITKYDDIVKSISNVSKIYEIFDIKSYLKDKIDFIEKNFIVSKYRFKIYKGVQELILTSDEVNINGVNFRKSFFILNSSDRSRRLSFYSGLSSDNFYIIPGVRNIGLSKKHLKGITKAAEDADNGFNFETFEEQINDISRLIDHRISLSNIQKTIVDKVDVDSNHMKFDAFKNSIVYASLNQGVFKLTKSQVDTLKKPSKNLVIDSSNDFYIDAFWAFQRYLSLFSNKDTHIIKNETDKIMKITQSSIRNNILESLGIF